jgi:serine/threonine-protein kinase
MALQAGRLFGNYRVVRMIGEGAFGEVYLAENPRLERRVAVKVLRPLLAQDAELVRRFFNEARAASAIRHPSIIEVFDAGETPEGFPYILMEFLEGSSLKARLKDVGKLSLEHALNVTTQAGTALAAAHAIGIVHRDLKPENLFLVPDAAAPHGERVKILDFGIAKVRRASSAAESFRTETGLIMGSPTYMSPEQCKDSADVDLRSDIYSLATISYEMMAGRPPYLAETGVELLLMHLTETPRPLRQLAPHVPVHVHKAIMRALQQERTERFDNVATFLGALMQGQRLEATETLGIGRLPQEPGTGAPAGSAPASDALPHGDADALADVGSDTYKLRRPSARRLALLSGVAAVAFASFLLLRRGHDLPVAAHVTRAAISPRAANPTVADRPPSEEMTAATLTRATAVDGKAAIPNAKPAGNAPAETESPKEATRHVRERTPRSRRSPSPANHESAISNSAVRDQEDVAGF